MVFINKRIPITMKAIAAMLWRILIGTIFCRPAPTTTANKVLKIKASDPPKKTANGYLLDKVKENVASWVLSPSSAKKTVPNTVINNLQSITFSFPMPESVCFKYILSPKEAKSMSETVTNPIDFRKRIVILKCSKYDNINFNYFDYGNFAPNLCPGLG